MSFTFYQSIVFVFSITAVFDLIINLAPPPFSATLIREYFDNHTPLAAALIAGFVGAATYALMVMLKLNISTPSHIAIFQILLVSAIVGFPMQWSGLFPHLNKYYYGVMPRWQSFLADGLSGVMVASVYWMAQGMYDHSLLHFWISALTIFFAKYEVFYPR
tara:strand:+ start:2840 stop:3322 length:483 start_codon:yes stop_codon:yes gene_type:complete